MSTGPAGGGLEPTVCSACASTQLTRLPMVLTDGTEVTFVSCHACERREWFTLDEDGLAQSLPIETVLARSAKKPR